MIADALPHPPAPLRSFTRERIQFHVYDRPEEMGAASAAELAREQIRLMETQERIGFLLMAAPSAFPFYRAYLHLAKESAALRDALARTHFFQFDDYPLPSSHPASFRHLLETHFYSKLRSSCPGVTVHPLNVDRANPDELCRSYTQTVLDFGPDLQLKGVGENGHWGFHEPGIPLDGPPAYMRVDTSEENVAQQLRDHPALFRTAGDVPRAAYTANVPLFLRTRVCIEDNVPQASKALALLAAYGNGIVDAAVPTSALKRHAHATVRTTTAAAWALERYAETGIVSRDDLARLAESLGRPDAAECRSYIIGVLEAMKITVDR